MTLSVAVVCEAPADRQTACTLADLVLCAEVDWISEEVLDAYRAWRGLTRSEPQLLWRDVPRLARARGIEGIGFYRGQPGAPDAYVTRLALLLLGAGPEPPDAILLVRDDDRQTTRRRGLEQARDAANPRMPVVLGVAHTKRECWALAGFVPKNDEERARLEEVRQELGFYPCAEAEHLTAKHDRDKRSAKRVLGLLTNHDRERETECWVRAPLSLLEERGRQTGLTDYLNEVRSRLVPLLAPAEGERPGQREGG